MRPGARILWVGPSVVQAQPYRRFHAEQARSQREQSQGPWVDVWMDSGPVTGRGWRDGVHFTQGAYMRWARAIAGQIRPEEAPRSGLWALGAALAGALALWGLTRAT